MDENDGVAKNLSNLVLVTKPVLLVSSDIRRDCPPSILFGQAGIILLRSRSQPCQGRAVVPGHPDAEWHAAAVEVDSGNDPGVVGHGIRRGGAAQ